MSLNLKEVNITNAEDWLELEQEWHDYFNNEYSFQPIKKKLSKLNVIVGFGRGFWSGVDGYSYLIYHKETDKFYWYLRNIESDQDVYFYEIKEDAKILELLKSKSIENHFNDYDEVLDYGMLYSMSVGKTE